VPWLRRLVAGLSPRTPEFDPGSVYVGFVVDKVALGQVFLPVLQFSHVSMIPPMLHTHLHINTTLIRRTSGRMLKVFKKPFLFGYQETLNGNSTMHRLPSLFHSHLYLTTDSEWEILCREKIDLCSY
jgi:hypothetical protein